MQIDNDPEQKTYHFMPEIAVDPVTNDVALVWLDSRDDQMDTSTRVWGTVIKNGFLPKLS